MAKVVIVKTGSTMPALKARRGDFEDWIRDGMGIRSDEVEVVDVSAGQPLPPASGAAGIVITGSHDMVTDRRDWSEQAAQWLGDAVDLGVPTLGVCYGHQLLAYALGGEVGDNPLGQEMGTTEISLVEPAFTDRLFRGLPAGFEVHVCHSQSVLRLPTKAVRLAGNAWDSNQAFRLGECAWGVQFHPEFDSQIMQAYAAEDGLPAGGRICEAPVGARVLTRFAAVVNRRSRAGRTPS